VRGGLGWLWGGGFFWLFSVVRLLVSCIGGGVCGDKGSYMGTVWGWWKGRIEGVRGLVSACVF